jgi:hypothetical protein
MRNRDAGSPRSRPIRRSTLAALAAATVLAALTACQPMQDTTSPSTGATPTAASAASATKELDALTVATALSMSGYDRDKFRTWDSQGDGCDTRDVVLKRQGHDVRTTSDCKIIGGTWKSPYNGKTYDSERDLDIDHLVPLGDAWISGAENWSASKREDFANDLKDPQLLAVDLSDNRSKGDDSPADWRPPDHDFWCTYARDWITVKTVWSLSVTSAEKSALDDMLATCT